MNKTAIKNFAVWARDKLIKDVEYKASLMGIEESGIQAALPQSSKDVEFYDIGTKEPNSITGNAIAQRKQLADKIAAKAQFSDYKTAYRAVLEEVAYTWFNRLIAIRFMEINDYLPSRIRVLSSESGTKSEPDLVTTPFEAELALSAYEQAEILRMKNDNLTDDLFRMLFIKQCNALHKILPKLFELTADYTEVLLNVSATDPDGVIYHLVHDIDEDDFNIEKEGQVEIIGWLYQYYNTEPKDETFALLKKNVKITKERIPAATQLFTPDWIVRYMVENSLGRLWAEGHPYYDKSDWKYYLEEAEQQPEVEEQLKAIRAKYKDLNPTDIKLIDPCMGSGHILVYAFEVLMQIYTSCGYSERDAAVSIVEHNLYGLDIDTRAAQLAYFAIMMKARQYNRRFFRTGIQPHIHAIHESNGINSFAVDYFANGDKELQRAIHTIMEELHNAKEYGSILNISQQAWDALYTRFDEIREDINISRDAALNELFPLVQVAQVMAQKYDVVVTNPPYMGASGMDARLSNYVKKYYPDSKSDMFAVLMERCKDMTAKNGYQAMITQHAWMFLSSFEKLRAKILLHDTVNMAHLGARAFEEIGGEVVQTTSFVFRNSHIENCKGVYCRLIEPTTQQGKEDMFLAGENRYFAAQDNFSKIPGAPVAYWVSDKVLNIFNSEALVNHYDIKAGMCTGENGTFILSWQEVNFTRSSIYLPADYLYTPHNKGGEYRKWYGNRELFLKYNATALKQMETKDGFRHDGKEYYFREHIGWSKITSAKSSFRYFEKGFTFDSAGLGLFGVSSPNIYVTLAFLNSKISEQLIALLNPTLNVTPMVVKKLPYTNTSFDSEVENTTKACIQLEKADWDSFETSWDFTVHPLIIYGISLNSGLGDLDTGAGIEIGHDFSMGGHKMYEKNSAKNYSIQSAFEMWSDKCNARFNQLKANEEELNRIFIDIYGLQDELSPEVEDKDVTVRKADLQRDIKSLLSYAVGCMFGRYSLDTAGLAYAGGDWDDSKYSTFLPDKDNCIPLTDEEYLEDDVVSLFCAWLKKVYGERSLEENLNFIANALGNKGKTSREVIRNYFLKDFFKDHCKIYQKRPIYWLFDSGKQNGFKALIYLHRYDENTIGNVRIDYLHRIERIYESEISRMQDTMDNSSNAREVSLAAKRREKLLKQVKECKEYDEKIAHLALSRIALDLDDGVKVNYRKIQTASDGKLYEVLADAKAIMAKGK